MGSYAELAIHCEDIKRIPRRMLEELAKISIRITDENPLPRPEVKLYLVSSSSLLPRGWVRIRDYLFWLEHADNPCEEVSEE